MKSIHLTTLPSIAALPNNTKLSAEMDDVRHICNAALSLRKEAKIRVRVPLANLTIYSRTDLALQDFAEIIKNEINIKNISFSTAFENVAREKPIINLRECAKTMSRSIPGILKAINAGQWALVVDGINVAGLTLPESHYEIKLGTDRPHTKVCANEKMIVSLDTNITEELEREGIARDIVRMIQNDRKDMLLSVSDRVEIGIESSNPNIKKIVLEDKNLSAYIANETLATSIDGTLFGFDRVFQHDNDEIGDIIIGIRKTA